MVPLLWKYINYKLFVYISAVVLLIIIFINQLICNTFVHVEYFQLQAEGDFSASLPWLLLRANNVDTILCPMGAHVF